MFKKWLFEITSCHDSIHKLIDLIDANTHWSAHVTLLNTLCQIPYSVPITYNIVRWDANEDGIVGSDSIGLNTPIRHLIILFLLKQYALFMFMVL